MAQKRVAIIGAGMAGLTAAVQLAKRGHAITLVERAKYPGGAAGYYMKDGVRYPTGATIMFGLEPGGPLRALLEDADADFLINVEPEFHAHSMDVVLEDAVVKIHNGHSGV